MFKRSWQEAAGEIWDLAREYISPEAMRVVNLREALAVISRLKNSNDESILHQDAVSSLDLSLPNLKAIAITDPCRTFDLGERYLYVYFHQLLSYRNSFLVYACDKEEGITKARLSYFWKAGFLESLRFLYRGFYLRDSSLFDKAIKNLGLTKVRSEIEAHLGGGNQDNVVFSLNRFRESFHRFFLACKKQGVVIDADFIPLGLMLVNLYYHLEELHEQGVKGLNVRRVFLLADEHARANQGKDL